VRALVVGVAAWLAAGALTVEAAAVETCATPRIDVADWPILRSARVPGFTLRLPRSFALDADSRVGAAPTTLTAAGWTDSSQGRFALSRLRNDGSPRPPMPSADGRAGYRRCEAQVGTAVADIVSFADQQPAGGTAPAGRFVVHARVRWPDGEELVVSADAAGRAQLDQLLAAVRTIRRTGA
jgi:hypothetical protein